jgi:hypothetical protein
MALTLQFVVVQASGGRAMTKTHLPSIEALTANDDELLTVELKVSEVKDQLAVARALIDAIGERDLLSEFEHPSETTVEEIAQLGKAFVAIASALTEKRPVPDSRILFTAHACPRTD